LVRARGDFQGSIDEEGRANALICEQLARANTDVTRQHRAREPAVLGPDRAVKP
jgi:hypothetical protein